MKTDETNPQDWLVAGKTRLQSADRLHVVEGSSPSVIELLQEAVERYLKAYLISKNWLLVRTHDLNRLLAEAVKFDPRFASFADFAQSLTEQFWEQHYPGGDLSEVGADYPELRQQAGELVALIRASISPPDEPKQP
jgi:HEPN domain-containing protein